MLTSRLFSVFSLYVHCPRELCSDIVVLSYFHLVICGVLCTVVGVCRRERTAPFSFLVGCVCHRGVSILLLPLYVNLGSQFHGVHFSRAFLHSHLREPQS